MHTDWKDANATLSEAIARYRDAAPDLAKGFRVWRGRQPRRAP